MGESRVAALAYGMINEQDGYEYYRKICEHVRDKKGKQMFQGLATDEAGHYRILVAEYESIRQSGEWLSITEAERASVPAIGEFQMNSGDIAGAAIPEEHLFPDLELVIRGLDAGTGDLQAVDLALQAEKRGYELYLEAYEQAADPNAKAAYQLLMDEENRHYQWLQRSRHYLASNGTYWDDTELPFFTG